MKCFHSKCQYAKFIYLNDEDSKESEYTENVVHKCLT